MSLATDHFGGTPHARAPIGLQARSLGNGALWLAAFLSGFVIEEPAPYELYMALLSVVWLACGLKLRREFGPLIICLMLYIAGGVASIPMAKEMGADRVIVMDRLENRLELAEEFGADHTINIEEFNTPETRLQRVRELTDGRGADVVMELVGRAELLAEGIDMLSNGGTFVEIGDIVRGKEVSIDPSKLLTGKNIVGSLMYKPELLPRLLNFLVRKQDVLPFDKIVSHTFPLAEVNDAFVQAEWDQSQTPITRAMLVP